MSIEPDGIAMWAIDGKPMESCGYVVCTDCDRRLYIGRDIQEDSMMHCPYCDSNNDADMVIE